MKKKIDISEYGNQIIQAIPKGVLLNSKDQKFNAMIIGWGGIGTNWGLPVFTIYVREGRFTRQQLDQNPAFTISIPMEGVHPEIARVCGTMSGRQVDKVSEAGLTLEAPEMNGVPGVKEYPLTLECKVLYRQEQKLDLYADKVMNYYPQDVDSENTGANKDPHVMYIGEIVDAYIIE